MSTPARKGLLLIGGGHAHLFVLETLRNRRAEWEGRLEVALITRDLVTPYSGMLPGLIAGHYRTKQCHIDLAPLAKLAGVTLVHGTVESMDLDRKVVTAGGTEFSFDMLSLDIGSTPPLSAISGAADHAISVKPIDAFLQHWRALQEQIDVLTRPIHIVVAGGGAGGVEVALAMAHRLAAQRGHVKWSLVTQGDLMPGYPRRMARLMARHLNGAGVALRTNTGVSRVEDGKLFLSDGSSATYDALVWATGAAAQPWLAESGLTCVDDGFVQINDYLQSVSHPHIFAAGDIASNPQFSRPKAGVFAVRQGPILAENLLQYALGGELSRYQPQPDYLSLVSTGKRHAIASWYGLVWEGDWLWRWKNRIDQAFMRRFSAPFAASSAPADEEFQRD